MAQAINTNVSALFATVALNKSNKGLQVAQQRLSSGLRINSAADDPTGLGIASGFESTARGATAAARSTADAITLAQTADGYLGQIYDINQKLREIAVIAGGTAASAEATALYAEASRIAGLLGATNAVVVASDGTTIATTGTTLAATAGLTVANFTTNITNISTARSAYGADIARFSAATALLQTQSVNAWSQYSRVMDTDYAAESASAAKNNILQQAGMAALAQANQNPQSVLTLLR